MIDDPSEVKTDPTEDQPEASSSRKPLSSWFKKHLVMKMVQESKMNLSGYGYTGKNSSFFIVAAISIFCKILTSGYSQVILSAWLIKLGINFYSVIHHVPC